MKTMHKLAIGMAAALLCFGTASIQAGTYNLTAITSGNWNGAGNHDPTTLYQVGFNLQHPNGQIAYFEFDLDPAKGKTYTLGLITIPGSEDYRITTDWSGHPTGQQSNQFKAGIRPICNTNYPISLNTILTATHDNNLYINANDGNRNQDLGYEWVKDGFHFGQEFGFSTYNTQRFQYLLNQGGDTVLWAVDEFDTGTTNENYIWGSTSYNTNIVAHITTSN
jgi:hypothetical protein